MSDNVNTIGRVLGELICEKYGIPHEFIRENWEATGDNDEAVVTMTATIHMTMDEFNDLLDRARSIGAPAFGQE